MPNPDFSAIAKWPDVPAVYGWLRLDCRGAWRLKGDPVRHAGLAAFLGRQYASDAAGEWFVQNGPQRVFVALDYTPWVYRLAPDGSLTAHTGETAGPASGVWVDDEGSVLLATALGVGLVDDRDLAQWFGECRGKEGEAADAEALAAWGVAGGGLSWRGMPVRRIARQEVAARFGFNPEPAPGTPR